MRETEPAGGAGGQDCGTTFLKAGHKAGHKTGQGSQGKPSQVESSQFECKNI